MIPEVECLQFLNPKFFPFGFDIFLWVNTQDEDTLGMLPFIVLMSAFFILTFVVIWYIFHKNQQEPKTQTYSSIPYVLESYDNSHIADLIEFSSLTQADQNLSNYAHQAQDLGLLSDKVFPERKRENLREFLEIELLYFRDKYLERLHEKDQKRLLEDEKYLQRVLKTPGNTLNPNFSLINTYIDNFIRNEGLWEKYRENYTRDSIINIKAKFIAYYKKMLEDVQVSGDQVLHFYLHSIKKFEKTPEAFLTSKQVSQEQIQSILSKKNKVTNHQAPYKKKIYPLGGEKFEGGGSAGNW